MDFASSELIEQMRKNEAGIWAGVTPIDDIPRTVAYRHIAGRDMSVLVGVSQEAANEPVAGLATMARGLAAVGSLIVLIIAGIFVWTIATLRTARQRLRSFERSELNLVNTRHELAVARARSLLSESEAGALIGSATGGVARLDAALMLTLWNERFAELAGVAMDEAAAGKPVEDLFRRQAAAGLLGGVMDSEAAIATRLTVLHSETRSAEPLTQTGPDGEPLRLSVLGVYDGGRLLLLTHADGSADAGTAEKATEW
jgi:PAS domain-containing protein